MYCPVRKMHENDRNTCDISCPENEAFVLYPVTFHSRKVADVSQPSKYVRRLIGSKLGQLTDGTL
jgi:hypothetical protein